MSGLIAVACAPIPLVGHFFLGILSPISSVIIGPILRNSKEIFTMSGLIGVICGLIGPVPTNEQ